MPYRQVQLRRGNVPGIEQDDFLFQAGDVHRPRATALRRDQRVLALGIDNESTSLMQQQIPG